MKFYILLVALVCSVKAAPQIFGNGPPFGGWFQNSFQQFQNTFPQFPRPTFPIWNQIRPGGQVTQNPAPAAVAVASTPIQEVPPTSSNAPTRQAEWFWQNWLPLPLIQQYPQEQPLVIIISRPGKRPATQENIAPVMVSNEIMPAANPMSVQPMNESSEGSNFNQVPNSLETTNTNESTAPQNNVTTIPQATTGNTPTAASSTVASNEASVPASSTESSTTSPDLGLTVLNSVPLAAIKQTNSPVPALTQ